MINPEPWLQVIDADFKSLGFVQAEHENPKPSKEKKG